MSHQLRELCERQLDTLNLVVLLIEGITFDGQTPIVALGVEESDLKHILGLWQGTTENTTLCTALFENVVARGFPPERRYLFVLDGSKALRAVSDALRSCGGKG